MVTLKHTQTHRPVWAASEEWEFTSPGIWRKTSEREEDLALRVLRTVLDQPRWLEARFLYDERGSELFTRICELPEYYLTRVENSILERHSDDILAEVPARCLVEIGAGYSVKTRHLLESLRRIHGGGRFVAVDVSLSALRASRRSILREFPQVEFLGLNADLGEALSDVDWGIEKMVVFLGSSIGNLPRTELTRFLEVLSRNLGRGDYFLLGVDHLKDPRIIHRAYDDAAGLTGEFILNVFDAINGLVGSRFDREAFEYRPHYSLEWQQMEMWVVARREQSVDFPGLSTEFRWRAGERLLVEISRKFQPERLAEQLSRFGLRLVRRFSDPREWFSLMLFRRI
jgi:L-histidine Nalpha-methyltransferase